MIKLSYKKLNFNDLTILYARYRKNRSIRLTVNNKNEIKLTCPYFCTDEDILKFIEAHESWLRKTLNKNERLDNLSLKQTLSKVERKILLDKIMLFVQRYEILMNTKVNKVTLRNMRSLWGSCSHKTHCIRFNTKLYYMSDQFIEYVVVHEMCHFFIANHSQTFKELEKKYLPNYKEIKKESKNVTLK